MTRPKKKRTITFTNIDGVARSIAKIRDGLSARRGHKVSRSLAIRWALDEQAARMSDG